MIEIVQKRDNGDREIYVFQINKNKVVLNEYYHQSPIEGKWLSFTIWFKGRENKPEIPICVRRKLIRKANVKLVFEE